jgi:hypothetical protein
MINTWASVLTAALTEDAPRWCFQKSVCILAMTTLAAVYLI